MISISTSKKSPTDTASSDLESLPPEIVLSIASHFPDLQSYVSFAQTGRLTRRVMQNNPSAWRPKTITQKQYKKLEKTLAEPTIVSDEASWVESVKHSVETVHTERNWPDDPRSDSPHGASLTINSPQSEHVSRIEARTEEFLRMRNILPRLSQVLLSTGHRDPATSELVPDRLRFMPGTEKIRHYENSVCSLVSSASLQSKLRGRLEFSRRIGPHDLSSYYRLTRLEELSRQGAKIHAIDFETPPSLASDYLLPFSDYGVGLIREMTGAPGDLGGSTDGQSLSEISDMGRSLTIPSLNYEKTIKSLKADVLAASTGLPDTTLTLTLGAASNKLPTSEKALEMLQRCKHCLDPYGVIRLQVSDTDIPYQPFQSSLPSTVIFFPRFKSRVSADQSVHSVSSEE